jgi:hypothetical protein
MLCPSAPGTPGESVLIGVVTGSPGAPRVAPTEEPLAVTVDLLALAEPVSPSEVFRFASKCWATNCTHFKNDACQLAVRSVDLLQPVVEDLPKCSIRPVCRWFRQEGAAICRRCPQIVTDQYRPYDQMLQIVYGTDPPDWSHQVNVARKSGNQPTSVSAEEFEECWRQTLSQFSNPASRLLSKFAPEEYD